MSAEGLGNSIDVKTLIKNQEPKEPKKKILGDLEVRSFISGWPRHVEVVEIRWCKMSDGSFYHALQFTSEEQVDALIAELIKKKEIFTTEKKKESENA